MSIHNPLPKSVGGPGERSWRPADQFAQMTDAQRAEALAAETRHLTPANSLSPNVPTDPSSTAGKKGDLLVG